MALFLTRAILSALEFCHLRGEWIGKEEKRTHAALETLCRFGDGVRAWAGALVGEAAPLSPWAMQMAPRNSIPAERLRWAGRGLRERE
jgi:hypothetical protein